jgi:hypothetical protein
MVHGQAADWGGEPTSTARLLYLYPGDAQAGNGRGTGQGLRTKRALYYAREHMSVMFGPAHSNGDEERSLPACWRAF